MTKDNLSLIIDSVTEKELKIDIRSNIDFSLQSLHLYVIKIFYTFTQTLYNAGYIISLYLRSII